MDIVCDLYVHLPLITFKYIHQNDCLHFFSKDISEFEFSEKLPSTVKRIQDPDRWQNIFPLPIRIYLNETEQRLFICIHPCWLLSEFRFLNWNSQYINPLLLLLFGVFHFIDFGLTKLKCWRGLKTNLNFICHPFLNQSRFIIQYCDSCLLESIK